MRRCRVQKRANATIKGRESAKTPTIRFVEGPVRPPFEAIHAYMHHIQATVHRYRLPASRARGKLKGVKAPAATPAEVPSVPTPRAPLDRSPCRCAGPLARLGAYHNP